MNLWRKMLKMIRKEKKSYIINTETKDDTRKLFKQLILDVYSVTRPLPWEQLMIYKFDIEYYRFCMKEFFKPIIKRIDDEQAEVRNNIKSYKTPLLLTMILHEQNFDAFQSNIKDRCRVPYLKVRDNSTCQICMEVLCVGDIVSLSRSCPHVYHASCMKTWISTTNHKYKNKNKCPLCQCKYCIELPNENSINQATKPYEVLTTISGNETNYLSFVDDLSSDVVYHIGNMIMMEEEEMLLREIEALCGKIRSSLLAEKRMKVKVKTQMIEKSVGSIFAPFDNE